MKNILSKIPQPIEEVVIYFSPELLDVKDVQVFTHTFDETVLMVRGKFAAEGEKFMLPRSARCLVNQKQLNYNRTESLIIRTAL
ncbi:hypothetical protein [Nostoc sp. 'Lobaria pulmonaria (5183) cyanobiont']|uniref:hypothetical protein n=1 Tax=Nostoc sp. 'Lobaria pulmonaria (5183) cyanobiont' TaxID=1618022 RepID=UPI0018F88646|nr:hypothetical protein [Nostoc sp. 'Lobaria pulmonaria (5183) cyanobiont']